MASTYTTNTGIELIATGEQSGTWGDTTNVNLQIIDRLTNGVGAITLSGTTHTLTTTDGTLSDGQYAVLVFGGTPTGTNTVTISPNDQQKVFFAKNESGESVILTQGSGSDVTIANGNAAIVYADGGGAGAAVVDLTAVFPAEGALLAANNLSDVDSAATSRINLGLAIGTDVQAYDAELQSIANITPTDGVFLVGDGTTFVSETGDAVLASIGVTATATELNYVDGVTSPIQDQLDNISVTSGTLTKTFSAGETSTIALSQAITAGAPVVSVTKEVPQTGLTSNTWDVATNGSNYDRHDTAYSTTLTPSNATGDGTFTLGTGSFASDDVGKTIEGNGGEAILTAADGSYSLVTSFSDTTAIASGDWSMYATVFDATNGLELSGGAFGAGVGFDLASYSYYGVSFSVTSQDTTPYDVFLKPDGTKMYILGGQNTAVYQYSLSTPFDLSTASYDNVSFSVSSQTSFPFSFTFKADGTAFFLAERQNEDVLQYTLSTAWDLSTASYASKSYAQAQDTNLTGIAFNDDGTKMYLSGISNSAVFQYSLSTAYDVSTASYDSVSLSLSAANDTPFNIGFNSDGSSLFVLDNDENIYQYNMTTAYDLSTASDTGISLSLSDTDSSSNSGFAFSNDGIKLYNVGDTSDSVYQYTTQSLVQPTAQYTPVVTNAGGQIDSTYWTDINSMTTDQVAGDGQVYYAVSTDGRTTWKVIDDTNGERPIVRDNSGTWQVNDSETYTGVTWVNAAVNTELDALQEALATAGQITVGYADASEWSYDSVSFSVSGQDTAPNDITFKPDGTKMYILGAANDSVFQYSLSTAFDLSTASYDSISFSVGTQEDQPNGIAFKPDGTKMYVTGTGGDDVNEYTLSTSWDISTASFLANFSVSAQTSNPNSIAFRGNGLKMFIMTDSDNSIKQYSLSTAWDISTASYDNVSFSIDTETNSPDGIYFKQDGTKLYVTDDKVYQYSVSTPWDISTASYDSTSFDPSSFETNPVNLYIKSDGLKMYLVGPASDSVHQITTSSTSSQNRMDKTQLEAVTDANHYTLDDSLDLMIALYLDSESASIPSSDGVSINYDAAARNEGAVLGTDYDFDFPATDVVRVTSNATQNLKVRVV